MATHEVTMADGAVYHVDAPDSMDPNDVAAQVAQQHQASIPSNSGFGAALLGAKKPIDNLAALASRIPVVGPAIDSLGQSLGMPSTSQANAYSDELRAKADPTMRTLGEVAGTIGIPEGRAAGLVGVGTRAIGNGAAGALLSDKQTAGGVAGDAVLSALGGEAAHGVVKGAAKLASPIVSDAVKALQARNIRLTPGQIAGGWWQKLEDGVQGGVLGLGDAVAAAKKRGLADFSRATINDALAPIGVQLPDHIPNGHEAVSFLKNTLSHAYDSVLGAMSAKADPALQQDVGNVVQNAATGPTDQSSQIQKLWDTKVAPYFQNGTMTGDSLKMVDRDLRAAAKPFRNSTDGSQQMYAQHVDGLRAALKGAAARDSGPDLVNALGAVDSSYANYVPVRNAASKTVDGNFTPTRLDTSVRGADQSVGKGTKATGGARMQDISSAAGQVLPSTVPDSGTARRLMLQSLFTSGAGGAGFAAGMGPLGAAAAGLGALAYTPGGIKVMSGLMTGRQGPQAQAVRGLLDRYAGTGGRVTAAGVPLLLARPQ